MTQPPLRTKESDFNSTLRLPVKRLSAWLSTPGEGVLPAGNTRNKKPPFRRAAWKGGSLAVSQSRVGHHNRSSDAAREPQAESGPCLPLPMDASTGTDLSPLITDR